MKSLSLGQKWSGTFLILAVCLVLGAMAVGRSLGGLDEWTLPTGIWGYVASACWWSAASALAAGSRARRLLLVWMPAVAPAAWFIAAGQATAKYDINGLAVLFLAPPTGLICLACLLASFGALLPSTNRARQP